VKQTHFDKIALFKVGKFYEIFYYDAFIAERECGLKWMFNDKKPHVGFPEMAKNEYAKRLVHAGYKVVMVEQTERVAEANERTGKATGSTISRAPCEVFTKGTVVDPEMIGSSSAQFMMYLCFDEKPLTGQGASGPAPLSFSACLVDCATSHIRLGHFSDAGDRNALRTLLAQVQPSEVVYVVANLPSEVLNLLRRLPCRPQLSAYSAGPSAAMARRGLERYRQAHPDKFSAEIEAIMAHDSVAAAAGGVLEYLESVFLASRVLPFAVWDPLEMPGAKAVVNDAPQTAVQFDKRMIMDAIALSALDVLETAEGSYRGSLLNFLDHTSTAYGFRLLKQWVCAPLYNKAEIIARQDAVEFLVNNNDLSQKLRGCLKKASLDIERVTSRVWGYALQAERQAVMYDNITARRLADFMSLLTAYEDGLGALKVFPANMELPQRLKHITRTRAEGGVVPELQTVITRLRDSVQSGENKKGETVYYPRVGADPDYDALGKQIEGVKAQLEQELMRLRKVLPNASLQYHHRPPGFRYEVEASENAVPKEFLQNHAELTSTTKQTMRFQTPLIKSLVAQLDSLDDKREDCIFPFLARLFQEFYAHHAQFRSCVRFLSELDAICSLAVASSSLAGASCRPEFVEPLGPDALGTLELRGCRHPVAASKMGSSFVPNDTFMNTGLGTPTAVPGILVVTGPNMGGKSTVLRQTCLAIIMAQLGCRVNAEGCRLSPVDRIFTRIGSYDTILEGKSTLLIELEETSVILSHGTPRSLAVVDELGRGTSTFDGAAIAAAVLEDLTKRVRCLTMFATHYHPVSRAASRWENVAPFHMAAGVTQDTNEMTFLYRFLPGLCPASHGHHVARLAGLPAKVLEEAVAKSEEFEKGGAGSHEAVLALQVRKLAEANDEVGLRKLFGSLAPRA